MPAVHMLAWLVWHFGLKAEAHGLNPVLWSWRPATKGKLGQCDLGEVSDAPVSGGAALHR